MAVAPDLGETPDASLDIEEVASAGGHTLILAGDLDMASAGDLQSLVVRLCAEGARQVTLDVTGLNFMDSVGLQAILAAQSVCRDHGTALVLTQPQGSVRRVFEITGMMDVLPFSAA